MRDVKEVHITGRVIGRGSRKICKRSAYHRWGGTKRKMQEM